MKILIARFLKTNESVELNALRRFEQVDLVANDKKFGFSILWKDHPEKAAQAKEYYSAMLDQALEQTVSGITICCCWMRFWHLSGFRWLIPES